MPKRLGEKNVRNFGEKGSRAGSEIVGLEPHQIQQTCHSARAERVGIQPENSRQCTEQARGQRFAQCKTAT